MVFVLDGSKETVHRVRLHHPLEIEVVCHVKDALCIANDTINTYIGTKHGL